MKMNGNGNGGAPPVTAKDIEAIIAKIWNWWNVQTIRIEQAPLKITTDNDSTETFKL